MPTNPRPALDPTAPGSHRAGYRPEIDGLRALAVIAVMLFHAKLGPSGGFLGVDVFFVVSGYLIAGVIGREQAAGTFRLAEFWARRVRRIVPALALAVTATCVGAWWLLLPGDLEKFGGSLAALGVAASNVYFWSTGGYFDRGAATQPLLHTWSLSVEEQFYLVFPLLFMPWLRFGRRRAAVQCLLAAASFALATWLARTPSALAFFALPTRAWELLFGALLHALPRPSPESRRTAEAAALLGLALLFFSWGHFTAGAPMPGLAAGLTCVGTALVIWGSQSPATWAGRVLGYRPLVYVGLVSYGLYLWHWPLLVFADYWNFTTQRALSRLAALVLAAGAATASWHLVERPIRDRRWLRTRRSAWILAATVGGAFVLTGIGLVQSGGAPGRWSPAAQRYAAAAGEPEPFPEVTVAAANEGRFVELGARESDPAADVLVWGDSHATVLLPVLDDLGRASRTRVVGAVRYGLAPLVAPAAERPDAGPFADAVLRFTEARRIRRVVLAAAWPNYCRAADRAAFAVNLQTTVTRLAAAGARVWIVIDVPVHPYPIPKALVARERFGVPVQIGTPARVHADIVSEFVRLLDTSVGSTVTRLDPTPFFATGEGVLRVEEGGASLYVDAQHLSRAGAARLRPLFAPVFAAAPANPGPKQSGQ